jgi:hypothetical protein
MAKVSWTRLNRMVKNLGGDHKFMDARFRNLFLRHHQNACEIITNKAGEPLGALYYTPTGLHQKEVKDFFKRVAYEMQYRCDVDKNGTRE